MNKFNFTAEKPDNFDGGISLKNYPPKAVLNIEKIMNSKKPITEDEKSYIGIPYDEALAKFMMS